MFYVQFTGTQERGQIKSRPSRRWQDDVVEKEGTSWSRTAVDRQQWGALMEGYILQWGALMEGYILQWGALMEGYILQWGGIDGGLHPAVGGH